MLIGPIRPTEGIQHLMEQLTSKERIELALAGQPVDRPAFCPFLAYVWEFFPQDVQQAGQLAFHHDTGADPLWRGAPCVVESHTPGLTCRQYREDNLDVLEFCTPVGAIRQGYLASETGNTAFIIEHPLKTEEDFKVQLWIEEHTEYRFNPQGMRDHLACNGCEGLSLGMLIPRSKSAYQNMIEHLVGTEELNYALIDYPQTVEALWHAMVENDLKAVELSLDADYQYYITWEDSSTQNYSPAQYDRYIGAEIRQWCDLINGSGKHYVQHACGHVKDLVVRMRDSGVYAVESMSPSPTGNLELCDARALVGNTLGIIGGIEPVHFLDLSMEALKPYVKQCLVDGAAGPFVLANSDSCPPGVTVEKFKLVADIVKGAQ